MHAHAVRVHTAGGSQQVFHGPFAEAKEMVVGFSLSSAPTWTRRSPSPTIAGPPGGPLWRCDRSQLGRQSRRTACFRLIKACQNRPARFVVSEVARAAATREVRQGLCGPHRPTGAFDKVSSICACGSAARPRKSHSSSCRYYRAWILSDTLCKAQQGPRLACGVLRYLDLCASTTALFWVGSSRMAPRSHPQACRLRRHMPRHGTLHHF